MELQPADAHKGSVVDAFMAEPPFAGRRPVFVGDDTDEDGFAAVNARDGISVRVGDGAPPATLARWAVPDVPAAHRGLAAVATTLAQRF